MAGVAGRHLRHSVFLFFNEKVTPSDLETFTGLLRQFSKHPDLSKVFVRYEFGPDIKLASGQPDFVISADFASLEDYQFYADHPDHLAIIEKEIKPRLGKPPVRAQFWLSAF